MDEVKKVRLSSSNGDVVEAPLSLARRLGVVDRFLEHCDEDDDPLIPLQNVDSGVLAMVLKYYESVPESTPSGDVLDPDAPPDPKDAYDADFFRMEKDSLFALVVAANYLDAPELLDGGCQVIADMVKGMSPEKIRQEFGITEEFTEAEMETARRENAWAFE